MFLDISMLETAVLGCLGGGGGAALTASSVSFMRSLSRRVEFCRLAVERTLVERIGVEMTLGLNEETGIEMRLVPEPLGEASTVVAPVWLGYIV